MFECALTTVLSFVTLGSIDEKRRKVNLAGLMVGFTVTCGIYSGVGKTSFL